MKHTTLYTWADTGKSKRAQLPARLPNQSNPYSGAVQTRAVVPDPRNTNWRPPWKS